MRFFTAAVMAGTALGATASAHAKPLTFTSLYTFTDSSVGQGSQDVHFIDGALYGVAVSGGANG